MRTFFLGISINLDLNADDLIQLKYLNLATFYQDNKWYIYCPLKIIKSENTESTLTLEESKSIRLTGATYQHFLNQLKRVSDRIYNAYNNDFGLKVLGPETT
jgi:hypothetical protein